MQKKTSIRFRILSIVLALNLAAAGFVVVFLHQSYAGGLDDWAQNTLQKSMGTLSTLSDVKDPVRTAETLKTATGSEYALLYDKEAATNAGVVLPDTAEDMGDYVVGTTTEGFPGVEILSTFNVAPADVTEKVVGVENGACSAACHKSMSAEGAYWVIRFNENGNSFVHTVVPIMVGDQVVGTAYAIEDVTAKADAARDSVYRAMAVIVVALLITTFAVLAMLNTLIFNRLDALTKSIEQISLTVAGGDFNAKYEPSGKNDEIGQFENFFAKFITVIESTLNALMKNQ